MLAICTLVNLNSYNPFTVYCITDSFECLFQDSIYIFFIFGAYFCQYPLKVDVLCYRCMLITSNHAGLEGYIIKNIRKQVEFSMQVK